MAKEEIRYDSGIKHYQAKYIVSLCMQELTAKAMRPLDVQQYIVADLGIWRKLG